MSTQNIHAKKLDIISAITSTEDQSVIEKIWNIIHSKTSKKEQMAIDLVDAFNDVKLHQEGKIKLKSAKDLLYEL
jgi:hypothetical protein